MVQFEQYTPPTEGERIAVRDGKLVVPDRPIIPFIEGDGTGPDIWRASRRILDAAVEKAYKGARKIAWYEVYAGEKAFKLFNNWLPNDTLTAIREYIVAIKGPLTTPVGGGIRSLNVALRQELDLYVCLRPVRYFKGVPSPVKRPELVDMVIFREKHGRHLRRHRMAGRLAGSAESDRISAKGNGCQKDPVSRDVRHRRQAGVRGRLEAARPRRDRICDPP